MAKYGLFVVVVPFDDSKDKPVFVYEGDYIVHKDEYVYIHKKVSENQTELVAVIRLAQGHSVKKIG